MAIRAARFSIRTFLAWCQLALVVWCIFGLVNIYSSESHAGLQCEFVRSVFLRPLLNPEGKGHPIVAALMHVSNGSHVEGFHTWSCLCHG